MHMLLRQLLLFALLMASADLRAQRTFDVTIADSTYHMKQYWMVLYIKGDGPALDSLTAATLQREHLAHQDDQAKRGLIVMAGPFDKNDLGWRGILLYDVNTREEVEQQLLQDPFVKAGRLKYEIAPWWGSVGTRLP
jgi:uncharacterized protein YciI